MMKMEYEIKKRSVLLYKVQNLAYFGAKETKILFVIANTFLVCVNCFSSKKGIC